MDRCKGIILAAALAALAVPAAVAGDKAGLNISAGVEKDFGKKWSMSAETEFRSRNNFRTADRWSIGIGGEYKPVKYFKISAGYTFLYDNFPEKITYNDDGDYNNWRPSYWGSRHRVNVSLTGSITAGRFKFSLRERWQYTYRPGQTTTRYDFDNAKWEDTRVRGKGNNVLRSRIRAEWNIRGSKVDPYADVEFFNSWALNKIRYTVGAEWKPRKQHTFTVFYRYQQVNNDDFDNEPNLHIIGLGYNFKF